MNIQPMNRFPKATQFGMALHIPPKRYLNHVIGESAAEQTQRAIPQLKKIAEDVDVFVDVSYKYQFDKNLSVANCQTCLSVKVLDLAEKIEDPHERFFAQHDWIERPNVVRDTKLITPTIDLASNLVETANAAKREFLALG